MAKSGIDDGEIWVNPKKKTAETSKPTSTPTVPGGVEEMPGTPRPAKPGRSSFDPKGTAAEDAEFRKQRPGGVEADAEVWDGEKWVYPSGKQVDEDDPSNAPKKAKAKAEAGPSVESDDDTEVVSTPRKAPSEPISGPLFGGGSGGGQSSRDLMRAGGKPRGKEGQDFQEYQRPLIPDPNARTFGLGGFVPYGAPVTPSPSTQPPPPPPPGYVPLVGTASQPSTSSRPGGPTQVWPPPSGAAPAPGPTAARPGGATEIHSLGGAPAPSAPRSGGRTEIWPPPAGHHAAQPGLTPGDVPRASAQDVHAKSVPPGQLNVLLIGSGAREHAMALAIRRSQRAHLFVITKHRNPGLVKSATGFKILDDRDAAGIVAWAKMQKIQLAVTGPESSLEAGVTDALRAAGIAVASPSQAAARIETSKTFMRDLMQRHQVPGRLGFHPFHDEKSALAFLDKHGPVWAIKPVGLTGGKGVQVHGDHFHDLDGAKAYVKSVFAGRVGGGSIQFEELARGEEFTVMCFTDGKTVLPMPAVQDHKRLLEGDKGPNTGGMGSYSCADGLLPFLTRSEYDESVRIIQGLVDALRADGTPYVGTIYGQFMLTATGPKVIEVNARFGDPEAMNVLHTLHSDYLAILEGMATGTLAGRPAQFRPVATVVKYVVPKGYGDGTPASGRMVEVDQFGMKRVGGVAFFGSIEQIPSGTLATMSSRTLGVLGEGPDLAHANAVCEAALAHVHGDGLFVRRDIGSPQLLAQRVAHMQAVRSAASHGSAPKATH